MPPVRRFILTGAAGFIGSHLVRALTARGDRVVGIDNFDPFYARSLKEANLAPLAGDRFELVTADVCDRAAMCEAFRGARPDAVVHLAALAGVRPSVRDPARFAQVNVGGLVSVLDATLAAGCRRFLFASSSSVYGNAATVPFSEADRADEPISPYAATKRAGEMICHAYAHLHGMSLASVRLFTVYGPAQRPDLAIASFMRRISAGEVIEMFGDGSTSRDYTYIDDIVAGVLAASDLVAGADPGFCRTFNLGGSHPVTLEDMIAAVAAVVGREPRVRAVAVPAGDVERTFADLTRSRDELGYDPRTPFSEGLERQWRWMEE